MADANDTPSSLSQTTNPSLNISKSERLNATVNSLNNKTKDSITNSNSNIKSNYLEFINSKKDKSKSKDADLAEKRAEREKAENEKASQLNVKKSDNGIYIEKAKEKHESIKTLNELYKVAESDVPFALAVMENVSKKYNTEFYARKGLKGLARAQQKIRDDYNGQANKLKDVFGGTIVIDKDKANIHDIFKSLIESNLLPIVEHKEPKDINNLVGYWDYKIICVAPNGTYFELIIIDKYINKIKMETKPQLDSNGKQLKDSDGNELKIHAIGHTLYEITRNLVSVKNNNDDVLSKKAKYDLAYWKQNLRV
mgnify:FL=1